MSFNFIEKEWEKRYHEKSGKGRIVRRKNVPAKRIE